MFFIYDEPMTHTVLRGTKDILPEESALWQHVEAQARHIFSLYDYKEIRTPIFELESLFNRVIGDESDIVQKEMYTFTDKGGRELALRPEGTAAVARAYLANHMSRQSGESKLYYLGPMFRYERPQSGRYRQFHQIGLENIGSAHPHTDAEIISLCYQLFTSLNLSNVRIHINSVGSEACRESIRKHVIDYFSAHTKQFSEQQKQTFEKNPLRLLDSKDKHIQALIADGFELKSALSEDARQHFQSVTAYLDTLGVPYTYSPNLVRGLDYYTDTVFEIISDDLGSQNSICGGGRYNHLIRDIGGPDTPAFGFAFGLERLILLLESQKQAANNSKARVYMAALGEPCKKASISIMQQLRNAGICVFTDHSKSDLNPHLKRANKSKATMALILGDSELNDGTIIVKNMASNSQDRVSIEALIPYFDSQGLTCSK